MSGIEYVDWPEDDGLPGAADKFVSTVWLDQAMTFMSVRKAEAERAMDEALRAKVAALRAYGEYVEAIALAEDAARLKARHTP